MMGAEEEAAARQRWLEARSADAMRPPPPQSSYEEEERLRKEARERMRQMMGGDNDKLKAGVGAAFGFGPEDDEDYGYGPPKAPDPRDEWFDDSQVDLPTWLTADPVGAKDYLKRVDEGYMKGESAGMAGFDGRPPNWSRKPELVDPNPPPMEDTLRAPAPDATPAQAFAMDFSSARADLERAEAAEAQQQEEELLGTLMGTIDEEEVERRRRKLEQDARNRPWNAP